MRSLPPQMRIPTFKQINRVLSAGWGAAIVALGVSRLIAAVIIEHSTGSHRLPDLLFGTAIPVVIIVYMLKFSADYPKRVPPTPPIGQNARLTTPATRPLAGSAEPFDTGASMRCPIRHGPPREAPGRRRTSSRRRGRLRSVFFVLLSLTPLVRR